ncbi:hypothetical protein HDK77DRAFT_35697 [Phyllosticta capitalensis]
MLVPKLFALRHPVTKSLFFIPIDITKELVAPPSAWVPRSRVPVGWVVWKASSREEAQCVADEIKTELAWLTCWIADMHPDRVLILRRTSPCRVWSACRRVGRADLGVCGVLMDWMRGRKDAKHMGGLRSIVLLYQKLMHAHVDLLCDSILLSLSLLPCSRAMRVMAAVFRLKDPLHLPESSFKLCSASSIYLPAVCMSLHRQLIKIQVFRLVSLSFRKRRVVWCAARPVLTALMWCSMLVSEWHTLLSILQALHVLPRPRSNAPF